MLQKGTKNITWATCALEAKVETLGIYKIAHQEGKEREGNKFCDKNLKDAFTQVTERE